MFTTVFFVFVMQMNSMLSNGLDLISSDSAMIIRSILTIFIFLFYLKSKVVNVSLLLTTYICVFFLCLNLNQSIINFIFVFWFLYSIRSQGFNTSIKAIYYSTMLFSLVFIVFSFNGIIHPEIKYVAEANRYRNSLGFVQVNYPGLMAFSIFMTLFICGGYIKRQLPVKIIILSYIIMAICFFIPIVVDSRTPSYAMLLSLVFYVFISLSPIRRLCRLLIPLVTSFIIGLTFLLSLEYSNSLNEFLSGRLGYFSRYLNDSSSSVFIFGSQLPKFPLDNSYLILLSCFGLWYIPFLIFFIYKVVINNDNKYMLTLIFSVLLYGLTESILARPEYPVVLLFYYFIINRSGRIRS